ncbi:MAG: glycosyltransferase family 2 protein [Cytophagales bacterium]|nr:glycosyltransferase family 2 protein [Cytophagales bacterium]MDW8383196.1 glycosyltransferase family 2 protein [Flammeovirgaceae bacterium]
MPKRICILIPCYNEDLIINQSLDELFVFLQNLIENQLVAPSSFIAVVDDGSTDATWQNIREYHFQHPQYNLKAIRLSRNQGHQTALLAGMLHFQPHYDCVITLDADLQDDYRTIVEMVQLFQQNVEIVYGVRKKRKTDSFFKKYSAILFYKFMQWLGVSIIENHADFRLTSSKVVKYLEQFKETNLFLRGIYPLLGFCSACVYYDRLPRKQGKSKYSLAKMIAFALEGVTSLSVKPLRIVTWLGFSIFLISIALSLYALKSYLENKVVPGWTSTVLPMYLLGGIQLLGIGIIGEYIGKIYQEVKQRPRYFIENEI